MNDVAFHFVFGKASRKYNLINLLNAILLNSGQQPIKDLTLQETRLDAETVAEKGCRLDIRAITSQNINVNIEVQILNQGNMEKRSLFYWSRLYNSQLAKGQDYVELSKTIAINILDFAYLPHDKTHSIYGILDYKTGHQLCEDLEIHFLELAKLDQAKPDLDNALVRWLLLLDNRTDPKLKEAILMKDDKLEVAYDDLKRLAGDDDAIRQYELREKAARDYRAGINFAREEGMKEGRKQGLEQGLEQAKHKVARNLLAKGLEEGLICEVTGLSVDELRRLKS